MHSAFQDLCIVQCLLLIYKQNCRNAPKSLASESLKETLLQILNKRDTQISDVVEVMAQAIAKFRGQSEISAAEFNTVHAAINKIIAPENELFLMVEKKLLGALRDQLARKAGVSSVGLSDLNVLHKLGELGEKLSALCSFNWSVFEPLYMNLFESIKCTK
jgi:hypothetical protein